VDREGRGVPQILDIVVVPVSRWSVLPELNRRAALQMLGVLVDRLVTGWPGEVAAPAAGAGVSPMLVQEPSAARSRAGIATGSRWFMSSSHRQGRPD
jgi:hypothetical protein